MKQLWDSNDLLGDRAALDAAWERDGFWYFRNVLNIDAVNHLRGRYEQLLNENQLLKPGESEPVWSGAKVSDFVARMDPLANENAWRLLIKDPSVEALFETVLGAKPFWIPIVVYRANQPKEEMSASRMDFVHQDGFYNKGIPFRICWIPLSHIDEPVGGLAIAPGMHRAGFFHDLAKPPKFPVPADAIPEGKWARADYAPGDLLLFDLGMPHTGLANHSDRFRLSMDIRVMPQSPEVPAIGAITRLDPDTITVAEEDGGHKSYLIDANTYCRDRMGSRFDREEIAQHMAVDDYVIVAGKDGVASVVRPLSY